MIRSIGASGPHKRAHRNFHDGQEAIRAMLVVAEEYEKLARRAEIGNL